MPPRRNGATQGHMIKSEAGRSLHPKKIIVGAELPNGRDNKPCHSISRFYLHAGQVHVSTSGCELVSIVGSCVAVLIWDSELHFGGGAHFLLPAYEGEGEASPRYGSIAMDMLISGLKQRGSHISDLVAHVYGGASVATALRAMGENLGQRNVEQAMAALQAASIRIGDSVRGGTVGRKVVFHTADGSAMVEEI